MNGTIKNAAIENRYDVYLYMSDKKNGDVIGQAVIPDEHLASGRYTIRYHENVQALSFHQEESDNADILVEKGVPSPIGSCTVTWSDADPSETDDFFDGKYVKLVFILPGKNTWLHPVDFLAPAVENIGYAAPILMLLYNKEDASPELYGLYGPDREISDSWRSVNNTWSTEDVNNHITGHVVTYRYMSWPYPCFEGVQIEHSDWALERNCRVE